MESWYSSESEAVLAAGVDFDIAELVLSASGKQSVGAGTLENCGSSDSLGTVRNSYNYSACPGRDKRQV